MKAKKIFYVVLALLLLASGSFSVYRCLNRPLVLPEFPQVQDGMPAAVLELEPDFGYRTGDIIPLRIYIRQPAGIACDTRSLLLNGDTKIREQASKVQLMPDGSQVLVLDVKLQSFVFQQRAKATLKMDYKVNGSRERKEMQLPELEYSTSQTFDGDKSTRHPKDPPFVYAASNSWMLTVAMATAALAVAACSFWYLLKRPTLSKGWWRKKKALMEPDSDAWKEAYAQVREILAQLRTASKQLPLVTNLDALLRRMHNMDAVSVQDLQLLSDKEHPELTSMTLASQYNQQVIYAGKTLDTREVGNLCDLVEEALQILPRSNWKGWLDSLNKQRGETCLCVKS